ncbi:hypothetical protein D9758_007527 [Tetrapyrgos nigripes]|uniref:F-box domain-containing protein n=1 Tax=Tetrapyrgos nigripes TaxID=182062 RepID=A0A8H5G3M3_9AGAR|nr:hypothetical protein D9758_007527 [Tetrapyrgos nigripes]
MHQALQLPELVDQILGYLEKVDQKRCVSVCQFWSDIALDYVWSTIAGNEDVLAMARLIAPVWKDFSMDNTSTYRFKSEPTSALWNRFQSKYSWRIRYLWYHYSRKHDVSPLLGAMYRTRPMSLILPNLRVLECTGHFGHASEEAPALLMHNGIHTFTYKVYDDTLSSLRILTEFVKVRMPGLTSLTIEVYGEHDFVEPLAKLLGNLPLLKSIHITAFEDMTPILRRLCHSAVLEKLVFSGGKNVHRVGNLWLDGHFSSLRELHVSQVEGNMTLVPFLPPLHRLQILHLVVAKSTVRNGCGHLIQSISQCSALRELKLEFNHDEFENTTIDDFDVLHSLLACSHITIFRFCSDNPLIMSDSDFTTLALAWPRLEELEILSPYGRDITDNKRTSIWAIFLLTRLCPHLTRLGLCINSAPRDTPPLDPSSLPTSEPAHGANLERLRLGYPLPGLKQGEETVFAELLGQILPAQCSLTYECFDYREEAKWTTIEALFPQFAEQYLATTSMKL